MDNLENQLNLAAEQQRVCVGLNSEGTLPLIAQDQAATVHQSIHSAINGAAGWALPGENVTSVTNTPANSGGYKVLYKGGRKGIPSGAVARGLSEQEFKTLISAATPLARIGKWINLPDWTNNEALQEIVWRESSRRPSAQNPHSSAFGLFQFLDSIWSGYGVPKTADPLQQTVAGLRYIYSKYKTPEHALDFHNANNYY